MGAEVCFTNHIHISDRASRVGPLELVSFNDLTSEKLNQIAENEQIKWIQIDKVLPEEAYCAIDKIFERRPDLYFRVFNIGSGGINRFDLSVLGLMPHLKNLWVEAYLRYDKDAVNIEYLHEYPNLTGLHLNLFDCRDYSFLNEISENLEELMINADTTSGSVNFDCELLLRFKNIHTLWLRKTKKHLERIAELPRLKSLSLCGIKVDNFEFLNCIGLDKFALMWCGNSDLSGMAGLETLKELELCRITKLENIDFVKSLKNLEVLRLRNLKHIKALPDTDKLTKLRKIVLNNVSIDKDLLSERERLLLETI